ncbi:MAG TPA: PHP-associated domain-containing protein [Vicinamibacterales bacterium]|nr:PHP-associated domain-containing protein [Vicinamibacterales bacterium]
MKLDTHVHTTHSGNSTIYPLQHILRESYNTPESVYRVAKARGMDLVVITDHDEVSGALTLSHLPDVIVGCEVTGVFPDDGVKVHLNVFGMDLNQHREIQRLRRDLRDLMPYLRQQSLFTSLNHVASGINGPITAPHVAALLPWVQALEVNNGSRLAVQNRTAQCLAEAAGKIGLGGSDSHTHRGIGRTWTEVPGARNREEFMRGLWDGKARVGGRMGSVLTMGSDVFRFAGNFCIDQTARVGRQPLDWRSHALFFGGILGLPLVSLALVGAYLHFVYEERFNENLLFDLVARPAPVRAQVPEFTAAMARLPELAA